MSVSVHQQTAVHVEPTELDALLAAITDGIHALVAWDVAAFQSAADRQSAICERLAANRSLPHSAADAATARRVRDLNRVYYRLLQHSIHWTRTLRIILQNGGHRSPTRASVHFRG